MPLTVKFEGTEIPSATVAESIEAIAAQTPVLSLATSGVDGTAHANMAFFALGPEFDLFFVSEPSTRHGRNVAGRPGASVAIWISPPEYGEHLQGMQLTGQCAIARDDVAAAAFAAYSERFPSFGRDPAMRESYLAGTAASSLYRFRVNSLTLVDEPRLGRRNYLNLDVVR
jgi:uncharacterized protein YhbP (UPF0306 family)